MVRLTEKDLFLLDVAVIRIRVRDLSKKVIEYGAVEVIMSRSPTSFGVYKEKCF